MVLWVNLCGAGEVAGEPRPCSEGAEVVTGTAGEFEDDGLSLSDLLVFESGVGDSIDFRSIL